MNKKGIILAILLAIILILLIIWVKKPKDSNGGNNGSNISQDNTGNYIGIVYLDPTDIDKKCTKEDSDKNVNKYGTPTGIHSGCMKFYIYDDDGTNYKMILDHNTSGNVSYSLASPLTDDVFTRLSKDTAGWVGEPRLINASEVEELIGKDRNGDLTSGDYNPKNPTISDYAWLYDYTGYCIEWGCSVEDNNGYEMYNPRTNVTEYTSSKGYWANEVYTEESGAEFASVITNVGQIGSDFVYYDFYGVRPVITLSKEIIDSKK